MAHKYYKQVNDEEHYLLSKEVAEIALTQFGISSASGAAHVLLISAALKEYQTENNIEPLLYYSGGHRSFLNVYPMSVYIPMLSKLVKEITVKPPSEKHIKVSGKNFSYKLEETKYEYTRK